MDSITPLKRCSKCGNKYPATTEHFYKQKRGLYGVESTCKKCRKEYQHDYRSRPEIKQHYREYHQSPKAKEYFRQRKQLPEVKEREREYERKRRQRPEVQEQEREYRARPEVREYHYEYNRRTEVKEKNRERNRKNRQKPEVVQKRHEYAHEYSKRPEVRQRYRLYKHERRAKERAGIVTQADIELQLKAQKSKCWHCGKKLKDGKYHIDHLVPIARGGKHDPRNIVIACPECNWSKNARLCSEWNGKLF